MRIISINNNIDPIPYTTSISSISRRVKSGNNNRIRIMPDSTQQKILKYTPYYTYYVFMQSPKQRHNIKRLLKAAPKLFKKDLKDHAQKQNKLKQYTELKETFDNIINMAPNALYEDAKNIASFICTITILDINLYTIQYPDEQKEINKLMKSCKTLYKIIPTIQYELNLINKHKDANAVTRIIELTDIIKHIEYAFIDMYSKNFIKTRNILPNKQDKDITTSDKITLSRITIDTSFIIATGLWFTYHFSKHHKRGTQLDIQTEKDVYMNNLIATTDIMIQYIKQQPERNLKNIKLTESDTTIDVTPDQSIGAIINYLINHSDSKSIQYVANAIDICRDYLISNGYDPILTFYKPLSQEQITLANKIVKQMKNSSDGEYEPINTMAFIFMLILQNISTEHQQIQKTKLEIEAQNKKRNINIDTLQAELHQTKIDIKNQKKSYEKQIQYIETKYKDASNAIAQFENTRIKLTESQTTIEKQNAHIQHIEDELEFIKTQHKTMIQDMAYTQNSDLQKELANKNFDNIIALLNHKNVVIIGGHTKWVDAIQQLLPDAFIHTTDSLNRDISRIQTAQYIIVNTAIMSHSMYFKIKSEVTKRKTPLENPIIYINTASRNPKQTLQTISDIIMK